MKLYPNCLPVVGYKKIAFYDLDRQTFLSLPKEYLLKDEDFNIKILDIKKLTPQGVEILRSEGFILDDPLITSNDCIALTDDIQWYSPALITNAFIEVTEQNELGNTGRMIRLLDFLANILCKHIVIHIKSELSLPYLQTVLSKIDSNNTNSLQLILHYNDEYFSDAFGDLIINNSKIQYVIIESSPFEKNYEDKIFFTEDKLRLGKISNETQFKANIKLYSESQNHHTYFNRKLFIGSNGEIKNAPECEEVFGNIQQVDSFEHFKDILESPDFQKYWYVHKNICEICCDCEYKHMCIDTRIPYRKMNGLWYHLEKCNYDPYSSSWN
ncbi:hypothetical protein [Pontibacter chinhatensis]|uniref:SPASM domain peptide maturase, grasp-with-spasm system n=1 Tax=Pontibacter chinhatensis TaxID=1436961 RepID=A0A1I2Z391_9BACT|nr:hypothetical protein [Pontibacter chinhatensis]SFH32009.1 hypothetical protein SAMN05421739_11135 [Pontibacter chinhatensis]